MESVLFLICKEDGKVSTYKQGELKELHGIRERCVQVGSTSIGGKVLSGKARMNRTNP